MPQALQSKLIDLLNWIDWLGTLKAKQLLMNWEVIITSLGPQIRRAIRLGMHVVESDEAEFGVKYWSGLRYLERELEKSKRF